MTAQAIDLRDGKGYSHGDADSQTYLAGPRLLPMLFFVLVVVAVFFAMIFLRISLDETAFELERIESGILIEESKQLDLRYNLATLQDPLRITMEAHQIGLVYPEERVAIVVNLLSTESQVLETEAPVRALTGDRP